MESAAKVELEAVPEGDSAWAVYGKLPAWARDAAALIDGANGACREDALRHRGYSSKQLKQVIHGLHPIAECSGKSLRLTGLGRKIAAIGRLKQGTNELSRS
jgi:hypothetical protein